MNTLPRWRGFNLLDMYGYRPGRETIQPGQRGGSDGGYGGGEGDFPEEDFQQIGEWGFDFVRIPMDYRYWTEFDENGKWHLRENVMARLDRVIQLGEKYGLHVSLNFHRAPGYCVNAPPEPRSLWQDRLMEGMFCGQWNLFAERYKGVSAKRLSFDLVNEPPAVGSVLSVRRYEEVVRSAVRAIRFADPERLVMVDGLNYGTEPVPGLADLAGVGQSCRGYAPFSVSHFQASWVSYAWRGTPQWPGADHFGQTWGRAELEQHFAPWRAILARGVGVHCGEMGAFKFTPHTVVLAWLRDLLAILKSHSIGWAMWNFRGAFGVLDSERADVAYETFRGRQLDRQMLELLRQS